MRVEVGQDLIVAGSHKKDAGFVQNCSKALSVIVAVRSEGPQKFPYVDTKASFSLNDCQLHHISSSSSSSCVPPCR
jgi:hypothetical protein